MLLSQNRPIFCKKYWSVFMLNRQNLIFCLIHDIIKLIKLFGGFNIMKVKSLNKIFTTILLVVIIFSCILVPIGLKCFRTTLKLSSISYQISSLNESAHLAKPGYGWTDERIAEYNALQAERQDLYNSSDRIVSGFAKFDNFAKLAILVVLSLAYISGLIAFMLLSARWVNILIKH